MLEWESTFAFGLLIRRLWVRVPPPELIAAQVDRRFHRRSRTTELARRDHRVVDTDHGGWSEDVLLPDGSGLERLWREDRMSALLSQERDEPLFVSGCTSNQGKFYDRFDAVVLLTAPTDVLLERLATRTTNPFGREPAERDRILMDIATVQPYCAARDRRELNREADTGRR
jgi:hypothetical protein